MRTGAVMKNLRWIILLAAIVGLVAFLTWSREAKTTKQRTEASTDERDDEEERAEIEGFSARSKSSYSNEAHAPTPLELAIDIREVSPKSAALLLGQPNHPSKLAEKDEASALILATFFLRQGNLDQYQALADRWNENSSWPAAWFVLHGDKLVAQHKKEEAIAHLQSKAFQRSQDVARLGRLALLTQGADQEAALQTLRKAQQDDPENALIPILIARTLEKETRITEAAQELSRAMKQKEGRQVQQAEALADLFRRYGYQPFAISVWDSVKDKLPEETAGQLLFWKKVVAASPVPEKQKALPEDSFLRYLASLPKGRFWDAEAFTEISGGQETLATNQETYWLRVLDYISTDNSQAALELIRQHPFKASSWNPSLEIALETVLVRKTNGAPGIASQPSPSALDLEYGTAAWLKPQDNALIVEILGATQEGGELSSETSALLTSPNAFSAILLAEGWEKAAWELHKSDASNAYPQWYLTGLTKAIAAGEGSQAALEFALKQQGSPELNLQIAELYMESGKAEEGLAVLEALRTENNELGARAAWITAQHYLRKGKLDLARQIIMANYFLAETPIGQETLAIISLKQAKNK